MVADPPPRPNGKIQNNDRRINGRNGGVRFWHKPCEAGSNNPPACWSQQMKRRDFLKSVTGAAASAISSPALFSAARADARSETLLIVSESGPNNLDIHGIGTNVPGYEVSWNCYDRLITHDMKAGPGGVPYYDRDKFKP